MKYLRTTTFGCRDIGIRKSEFVSKTHFLCKMIAYFFVMHVIRESILYVNLCYKMYHNLLIKKRNLIYGDFKGKKNINKDQYAGLIFIKD